MISITDELEQYLNTMDNASEFIRQAIDLKRGKGSQTLEEIEAEIFIEEKKLKKLNEEYYSVLNSNLLHREQLKLSEIKALEEKKAQKEKEERDFIDKTTTLLSVLPNYQDILQADINDSVLLRQLSEDLFKKDIRISPSSLKRFISIVLKK